MKLKCRLQKTIAAACGMRQEFQTFSSCQHKIATLNSSLETGETALRPEEGRLFVRLIW
jgi:hypothetical protein